MICDVLAGEQGPSCASLDQIPDLKVVHVRFIEPNGMVKINFKRLGVLLPVLRLEVVF